MDDSQFGCIIVLLAIATLAIVVSAAGFLYFILSETGEL